MKQLSSGQSVKLLKTLHWYRRVMQIVHLHTQPHVTSYFKGLVAMTKPLKNETKRDVHDRAPIYIPDRAVTVP